MNTICNGRIMYKYLASKLEIFIKCYYPDIFRKQLRWINPRFWLAETSLANGRDKAVSPVVKELPLFLRNGVDWSQNDVNNVNNSIRHHNLFKLVVFFLLLLHPMNLEEFDSYLEPSTSSLFHQTSINQQQYSL